MAKERKVAKSASSRAQPESYWKLSMRPLHILVFLAPLIALYELGSILYLADDQRGVIATVRAWSILSRFFETFGVASLHLPAAGLVIVLLVWHFFLRDSWRVRPPVIAGMAVESVLWCLPLIVFGMLIAQGLSSGLIQSNGSANASFATLPWQSRLILSAGAGLYEELLFRLILISGVHFLVVDLARQSEGVGFVIAAVVSAVAFALYHNISHPRGGADLALLASYSVAGLYFAALFLLRGFGVAVMTHALYDVVVLIAAPASVAAVNGS
jgi:hypothetical protein